MIPGDLQQQGIGGLLGTTGDGRTASMRHSSRGTVGPQSLAVGCRASLEKKTRRDDIMQSILVLVQEGQTAPLRTLWMMFCIVGSYGHEKAGSHGGIVGFKLILRVYHISTRCSICYNHGILVIAILYTVGVCFQRCQENNALVPYPP